MKPEGETSEHLLLASIVTVVGIMLLLITIALSWELWMVPIFVFGNIFVWCLHIGKAGTDSFFKNLCSCLLLIGFFFFGVHRAVLYDIAAVACMLLLVFSMFDKKWLLYITTALYVLELLYHLLILHTITNEMGIDDMIRLAFGIMVVIVATIISRYRILRRRKNQNQYSSALAELEMAERQNAEFLSNVSHELRTPINMVIGLSEVTLEKKISPEIQANIRSIKMAGKRLSNQINNILDYTEIVEGTLTAVKEPYMITSVLNDIIMTTAMQTNKQQLEMVFDINPRTPAVLIGDVEKISHVLKILLENSIKFTEEGGINIYIDFRQETYGVNLVIDVYDTGIGMTHSQIRQMCEDFYQADSGSSRFANGLGLGLPVARGLLHAMGGFIHFESNDQHGLHAHITIPQGVEDYRQSIELVHPERFCVVCYFQPEKYGSDEVRKYYDKMIYHMIDGLGIRGYQAHNFEGLLQLLKNNHEITHVFIAQSEFEESRSYYEKLAEMFVVVIIAEHDFVLDYGSRLKVIHKPFFALSVVNMLNGAKADSFEETESAVRRPFFCVNVRALAVDDEEMNLVVAKGVLGSYGIQVDTCLSGREALERCGRITYDIVFLDHMMPGFDGVETLKRLREINDGIYQDIPVVALTANTISGAREMFRNEGFTEFIAKPIERTVLERVLRRVLPKECFCYSMEPEDLEGQSKVASSANSSFEEEVKEELSTGSPFAFLEQVGFDPQMGLDYCGGDEGFYLEMLHMFYEQGVEKRNEITSLYKAANWPDYAVKVHALKSTSLTIGALELSEHAKALEQAAKKEEIEFIRENHAALLRLHEKVCASLARL